VKPSTKTTGKVKPKATTPKPKTKVASKPTAKKGR
jgi:hypothetical protein